jgi:hypothetical protein
MFWILDPEKNHPGSGSQILGVKSTGSYVPYATSLDLPLTKTYFWSQIGPNGYMAFKNYITPPVTPIKIERHGSTLTSRGFLAQICYVQNQKIPKKH